MTAPAAVLRALVVVRLAAVRALPAAFLVVVEVRLAAVRVRGAVAIHPHPALGTPGEWAPAELAQPQLLWRWVLLTGLAV